MDSQISTRRPGRPGPWQYPPHAEDGTLRGEDVAATYDHDQRARREQRLGNALGWLSVGIGLASLLAPRAVARTTGLPYWPTLIRIVGARELAAGVGLLMKPTNQVFRWSRVTGDAMDLTILGIAASQPGSNRERLAATAALVGSLTALDLRAGTPPRVKPSRQTLPAADGAPQRVRHSVSINKTPEECYQFWRKLEQLPQFMQHLESVKVLSEQRSHWVAKGPAGTRVEWDAEITEDQPGHVLGWRSLEGSDVDHGGVVRFTPSAGGTVVQVQMNYEPPAGRAGVIFAKLFGEEPSQQIKIDLRRFKQLIETGEIPTIKGQAAGKRSLKSTLFQKGFEQ